MRKRGRSGAGRPRRIFGGCPVCQGGVGLGPPNGGAVVDGWASGGRKRLTDKRFRGNIKGYRGNRWRRATAVVGGSLGRIERLDTTGEFG